MMSISQEYVAKCLGISQAAYSYIESGKTKVDGGKLLRLAIIMKVPEELFNRFDTQVAFEACLKAKKRKRAKGRSLRIKQLLRRKKQARRITIGSKPQWYER